MAVDRRILVVDDDEDIRAVLADVLERAGYAVVAVADGAHAFRYLQGHRPTVILLDLRMPDIDGWELLGALRGYDRWRTMPIVVMTGDPATCPDSVRCISKPFGIQDLLGALAEATA